MSAAPVLEFEHIPTFQDYAVVPAQRLHFLPWDQPFLQGVLDPFLGELC